MSANADSCLFCLCGAETERLIHNVRCRCNYTYHHNCFDRYDRKQICPLCKKDVGPPPSISDIAITIVGPGRVVRPPSAQRAEGERRPPRVPQPPQPPQPQQPQQPPPQASAHPSASNATPLIRPPESTVTTPVPSRQLRIMNIFAALGCAAIILTIIVFVANLAS